MVFPMSLNNKLLIFFFLLHAAEVFLAFQIYRLDREIFILAEAGIAVSIIISSYFYVSFTRPFNLIYSGIESIKNRDFNVRLKKTGQKDLDRLIEVYNRMIGQLREERVHQQEQQYFLDQLMDISPSGIMILDTEDRVLMMNPAAGKFMGVNPLLCIGNKLSQLSSPLAFELNRISTNTKAIINLSGLEKYKVTRSNFVSRGLRNQFFLIDEYGREIYKVERNAYENVIRIISHEFNNSVGPINSILESVKEYLDSFSDETRLEYVTALEVAIQKYLNLNSFVRNYARVFKLPPPHFELADLNKIALGMINFYNLEAAGKNIKILNELNNEKVEVNVDVNQFEQVLKNIFCNAMEAIADSGIIVVSTSSFPSCIKIINNGQPIMPEVRKNIFAPFFSSKKNGQGLGLTLAREILQNHGCSFSLSTRPDGWTEFRVIFPDSNCPLN